MRSEFDYFQNENYPIHVDTYCMLQKVFENMLDLKSTKKKSNFMRKRTKGKANSTHLKV